MPRALLHALALLALSPAAPALADHVTANPEVSAWLGERISDNAWAVVVDWRINCSGPVPGNALHTGDLNLDDLDSGEAIYMGGTSSASGSASERQPVTRRALPRRLRPRIRASCFDAGLGNHGSATIEVTGNTVSVPGLGDEDGDGAQGTRDFPRARFGGPDDPLRPGGCAAPRLGTARADALRGTAGADLILGLGGADLIRGLAGDDCLVGGPGADRLAGGPGHDRLTGGAGPDLLVGGGGVNRYDAGAGDDRVRAANGRVELVSCGGGRDEAVVDPRDRVRGCERVTRAPSGG